MNTEILDIKCSSTKIKARLVGKVGNDPRILVEVTLDPSLPPGKINQAVTAYSNLELAPEAILRITGTKLWDIEVTPDRLRYTVRKNEKTDPVTEKFTLISQAADKPLKILSAIDPKDLVVAEVKTLEEGQRYEVLVTPRQTTWDDTKSISGSVIITTDNPDQEQVTVRYTIARR